MSEVVITRQQIKDLIKEEEIRPEDLFDDWQISDSVRRKEAERRVREEDLKASAGGNKDENPAGKEPDYTDPDHNDFIKADA